jgi:hypothetical protein
VDAIIAKAVSHSLSQGHQESSEKDFCFTRFRGKGVVPGVNIDNSAELLDKMEEGLDISQRR